LIDFDAELNFTLNNASEYRTTAFCIQRNANGAMAIIIEPWP